MMETESKKGEKQKLVIETDDEVNKDTGIKEITSAKEVMRTRGEGMIKTKILYMKAKSGWSLTLKKEKITLIYKAKY
eukprot:9142019-Ditylum_brightwellii.AAC.1